MLNSNDTEIQNLTEETIEDIKVRCCLVTEKSRAEQLILPKPDITPCPDVKYPIGKNIFIAESLIH